MDNFDFDAEDGLLALNEYATGHRPPNAFPPFHPYFAPSSTWAFTTEELGAGTEDMHRQTSPNGQDNQLPPNAYAAANRQNLAVSGTMPIHGHGLGLAFPQGMNTPADLLQPAWQFSYQPPNQQNYTEPDVNGHHSPCDAPFHTQMRSPPPDYMPTTTTTTTTATTTAAAEMRMPLQVSGPAMPMTQYMTMAGPMESMAALAYPLTDDLQHHEIMTLPMGMTAGNLSLQTADVVRSGVPGSASSGSPLEICSLSSSDNSWAAVNFAHHYSHRQNTSPTQTHNHNHASAAVFNPGETLHIRSESGSSWSDSPEEGLSGSYEEVVFPMNSPEQEFAQNRRAHHGQQGQSRHRHQDVAIVESPEISSSSPISSAASSSVHRTSSSNKPRPVATRPLSSSSSPSPTSPNAPETTTIRRRKSPTGPVVASKVTKPGNKKEGSAASRKSTLNEKKVGRRRGPLRPDQRQQAHEIRKLRACLRCKFLKKVCDTGDPCGGCRPSHARLWQVPCTRIDIKDIGFFMKDWKADYERHVTLNVSVNNIKGFSTRERTLYITHGYGQYLPVNAREVYVFDDSCFGLDWVETMSMNQYEIRTAKLSAGREGVSSTLLGEYIDRHLDENFESFVTDYFEGTPFLTEILQTAYRYYCKTKTPVIRKALKLVLTYTLTVHITLVEGLDEDESRDARIDDDTSKFSGQVVAPVMINFQVKCALADMWRDLQKDVLKELSSLCTSVYQGDKLRNWPTIFMIASILLAVWELMQFDSHYRELDEKKVEKFCNDMESTPVGVIVGLFQAISQKLPSFMEWDTSTHGKVLNEDKPICDALTEIREHVVAHEDYLRKRGEAKFDREDFDSLSNKFLSRLVIRAN